MKLFFQHKKQGLIIMFFPMMIWIQSSLVHNQEKKIKEWEKKCKLQSIQFNNSIHTLYSIDTFFKKMCKETTLTLKNKNTQSTSETHTYTSVDIENDTLKTLALLNSFHGYFNEININILTNEIIFTTPTQ